MEKSFRTELLKKRNKEVAKVLKGLESVEVDNMPTYIEKELKEAYLSSFLKKLHKTMGYHFGTLALDGFKKTYGIKASPQWQVAVDKWSATYLGEAIVSISGSLKAEVITWLALATKTLGNELSGAALTKAIINDISDRYNAVKDWQVLRIVHTETMKAESVGQFESVKSLGGETLKTWVTTGLRTRAEHLAMEGVQVEMDEYFVMPNGDMMLYPRDVSQGAAAENVINCACGVIYEPKITI